MIIKTSLSVKIVLIELYTTIDENLVKITHDNEDINNIKI